MVSACRTEPPDEGGVSKEEKLVFRYRMYIMPDADPDDEAKKIERRIHRGLSETLLSCEYDTTEDFYITSFKSDPSGSISNDSCNVTLDSISGQDSTCFSVTAETTWSAFFPDSSRRSLQGADATEEVVAYITSYLKSAMGTGKFRSDEILLVTFQELVDTELDSGNGMNVTRATDSLLSSPSRSPIALGSVGMAAAFLFLVLVFTLATKRRKAQPKEYIEHLDELSLRETDLTMSREYYGDDGKAQWDKDDGEMGDFVNSPSSILDMTGAITTRHDPRLVRHSHNETKSPNSKFIHSLHLGYTDTEMRRMRDIGRIRDSYRSRDSVDF